MLRYSLGKNLCFAFVPRNDMVLYHLRITDFVMVTGHHSDYLDIRYFQINVFLLNISH